MNIFVSNLGFSVSQEDLNGLFADYGTVSSAKIIMDKATGRSRGFGFVEMTPDDAALKAIKELNGAMYAGRPLRVNEAKERTESNGRSNFSKRY